MTTTAIPPLSKSRIRTLHRAGMEQGIPYVWGDKPALNLVIPDIPGSDCSGWVRYLVYHVSQGVCLLPEGSFEQHAHLKTFLRPYPYGGATQIKGNLFLAFIEPAKQHAGHVWFVLDGVTLECYGGHGVGSRDALAHPLPQEVAACYHWPGLP